VKIDIYPEPVVDVSNIDGFFQLVKAGFTASRKQAVNSLAQGLRIPREEVLEMLGKAAIEPKRRAETFTLEEWATLWRVMDESKEVK
jgi:16S rRNA (adenine1518-N6/adenine1519-N6)-dimethyltransferase